MTVAEVAVLVVLLVVIGLVALAYRFPRDRPDSDDPPPPNW